MARGYGMRVYVPYGTEWYPYFMRRLAERPANVLFVLRSLFTERAVDPRRRPIGRIVAVDAAPTSFDIVMFGGGHRYVPLCPHAAVAGRTERGQCAARHKDADCAR